VSSSSITSLPVSGFLDALAAKTPTPGGGAAAGLTGAIGAALAAMVVRFTIGSESHKAHDEKHRDQLATLESIRAQFLGASEEDAAAYASLNTLWKLPKDDPRREREWDGAVRAAIAAPQRIVILSEGLAQILVELASTTKHTLRSDLAVSAALARAASQAAACNVRVNTPMLPEPERPGVETTLSDSLARIASLCAAAEEKAR
jgi:formiminotetrahydrofolate cyclodeaminase